MSKATKPSQNIIYGTFAGKPARMLVEKPARKSAVRRAQSFIDEIVEFTYRHISRFPKRKQEAIYRKLRAEFASAASVLTLNHGIEKVLNDKKGMAKTKAMAPRVSAKGKAH